MSIKQRILSVYLTRSCFARFLFCVPFASMQRRVAQLNFLFWFIYIKFYPSLLLPCSSHTRIYSEIFPQTSRARLLLQWWVNQVSAAEVDDQALDDCGFRRRDADRYSEYISSQISCYFLFIYRAFVFDLIVLLLEFRVSAKVNKMFLFNRTAAPALLTSSTTAARTTNRKQQKKSLFRRVQHVNEPLKGSDMRQQQANPIRQQTNIQRK